MAISVSVEEDLKFHHCSTFHYMTKEYEVPAFQYVTYAKTLARMMKNSVHKAAASWGNRIQTAHRAGLLHHKAV